MSREEALNKAIAVLTYHQANFCKSKEAVANMNEIINALEKIDQECVADNDTNVTATDAVSRQRVAEVLLKYAHSTEGKAFAEFLVSQINDLPSITPQSKMGQWVEHIHNGMHYIECPKCSSWFLRMYLARNSYCPNCGAKMQEVEE